MLRVTYNPNVIQVNSGTPCDEMGYFVSCKEIHLETKGNTHVLKHFLLFLGDDQEESDFLRQG